MKLLKLLKRIWLLNFIRRTALASKYFNYRYLQIIKWGFQSKEDTNFTYPLEESNIEFMAHTIAVASNVSHTVALNYINEAINDNQLKLHVLNTTAKSDFRHVADLKVEFGRRLGWYALTRILKPAVIIETGVDKGLGSVLLCAALLKNRDEGNDGQFYGTDINPNAGYLLCDEYAAVGKILYGDSIESLKKLDVTIDIFINDSDHSTNYEYREYQTIQSKLSPKGIIIGDNSHYSPMLATFSSENNRKFLFYKEVPKNHWYPGGGIGLSFN